MCDTAINRRNVYSSVRNNKIAGRDLFECAKQIAHALGRPEGRTTVKGILDKLLRSGDIEFHGAVLRGISPEERKEEKKRKVLEVQRRRRDRRRTAIRRQTKKGSCWRRPEAEDSEWDPEEATLSEEEYGFWCACTMVPHSPIGGWGQFGPRTPPWDRRLLDACFPGEAVLR